MKAQLFEITSREGLGTIELLRCIEDNLNKDCNVGIREISSHPTKSDIKHNYDDLSKESKKLDEQVDNIIYNLDTFARDVNGHKFGLPKHGESIETMRMLVKHLLNDL